MAWDVEYTDQFDDWWEGLTEDQQEAVTARVELLEQQGPSLGRPIVDSLQGTKVHNLKELRCAKDGALRVLFVFDPRRTAVPVGRG